MNYYTIQYNQQNEPYIIEKNYGYKPDDTDSSSHWTWHITQRGVRHLSKDFYGRPQAMPAYITKEQLEELKAYNMLRRNDGSLIGGNALYPSQEKPRIQKPTTQPANRKKKQKEIPVTQIRRPVQPAKPASPNQPAGSSGKTPPRQKRGFLAWLKSLFRKE